jgi:hypothetical protein
MPLRPPAGFISANYDPLKNPDAPTIGTATGGDESASVAFTTPANVGGSAITAYYAVSSPGQITGTAAASPVSVTGLTNGTAYTFKVWALNSYGPSAYSGASGSVTPTAPTGLFGGGYTGSGTNVIDYVIIGTTGNATDFGDLTAARDGLGACSSTSRGIWAGGYSSGVGSNIIDYIIFSTTGNATDFGDTTTTTATCGCSNATRGIFGIGSSTQYITLATLGNSASFGTLSSTSDAACSSPTRAVISFSTSMEYVTIATLGNGTTFGNLVTTGSGKSGCSSSTRGIFSGGQYSPSVNVIQYITIASTGDSIDFGDLQDRVYEPASTSSEIRGLIAGGFISSAPTAYVNTINYITIASTGNAADFGDLTLARSGSAGCSNAHGGL